MFYALIAIYIIQIIVMLAGIGIIRRGNAGNKQSMIRMIGTAVVTATGYIVSILIPAGFQTLAVLMEGIYFIGTDWLVIALVFFVADYTRIHQPVKIPKMIFAGLAAIDSISLIINTFTGHMFTLKREALSWTEYWQIQYKPLHYLHIYFVYFMVVFCVAILLYRMIKAPNIYKNKYGIILLLLFSVIVLNMLRSAGF